MPVKQGKQPRRAYRPCSSPRFIVRRHANQGGRWHTYSPPSLVVSRQLAPQKQEAASHE